MTFEAAGEYLEAKKIYESLLEEDPEKGGHAGDCFVVSCLFFFFERRYESRYTLKSNKGLARSISLSRLKLLLTFHSHLPIF